MIKTINLRVEENTSIIGKIDYRLNLTERVFEILLNTLINPGEEYRQFINTGNIDSLELIKAEQSFVSKLLPQNYFDDLPFALSAELISEIKTKRVDGNKMYFDFLNEVFARHYQFVKKHFTSAISNYFASQHGPVLTTLAYAPAILHVKKEQYYRSDADFLKNISFRYLHVFEELEAIVYQNYSDYKPLLSAHPADVKIEDYFRIDYPSEKLLEVYNGLNKTYIDCPAEQFIRIFEPSNDEIKKIKWLSTEFNLVMLFSGHNVTSTERLITHNSNNLPLIQKFFSNKKGEDFKVKQLGITYQKLDETADPRECSKLIEVIKELNS